MSVDQVLKLASKGSVEECEWCKGVGYWVAWNEQRGYWNKCCQPCDNKQRHKISKMLADPKLFEGEHK